MGGKIIESSVDRMETFHTFQTPRCKSDIVQMLGDTSGKRHTVFRENGGDEFIKTIAVGVFDCQRRTWELYSDNPKTSQPLVTLPIVLRDDKEPPVGSGRGAPGAPVVHVIEKKCEQKK